MNQLNLLQRAGRTLGLTTAALTSLRTLEERIAWVEQQAFSGIEIAATGGPNDIHAPQIRPDDRAFLKERIRSFFADVAVLGPLPETMGVSLVSPSSALRRASITEIWSACRFAEALGGGVVTVRTGVAPMGWPIERETEWLRESLETLDRVAGDHGVRIGVLFADFFYRPERLSLLEQLPLRHTGVTLDTNCLPESVSVPNLMRRVAPRLEHVRVAIDETVDRAGLADLAAALDAADYDKMVCLSFDAPSVTPPQVSSGKARWERISKIHDDDDPNDPNGLRSRHDA